MTERPFFNSKEPDSKSIEIRTHHLFDWGYGFLKTHTPEQFAQAIVDEITIMKSSPDERTKKWAYDLAGDDHTDYYKKRKKILERFVSLPDDYPVDLTVGQQDEICRACPASGGKHCQLTSHKEYTGSPMDVVTREEYCLDIFLDKAHELAIEESEIQIKQELAYFTDSPQPRVVRRAKTTAGVVKKVLNELPIYSKENSPK